ncbi:CarD family transcriptional regulator [Bacteriovoracales bacterium]|nr:CarD family transcriptional regulator [Bacteriovoracales bacterium]
MYQVSDVVISLAFGIGKIVEITELQSNSGLFYLIEGIEEKFKTFVPVNSGNKFRKISSLDKISAQVDLLKGTVQIREYKSRKERVLDFKEKAEPKNIEEMIKIIKELNSLNDRGSIENELFVKLKKNMAKEFSYVSEMKERDALEIIQKELDVN